MNNGQWTIKGSSQLFWLFFFLFSILLSLSLLHLSYGSTAIPSSEVMRFLMGQSMSDTSFYNILSQIRVPRMMTALLSGASLALCGMLMQTLFRNPLADPFALGVQSGASLGVALVVLPTAALGFGNSFLQIGSFSGIFGQALAAGFGALTVMFLILATAHRISGITTILVLGLLVGYVVGALVSLLVYFSPPSEVRNLAVWGLGSFSGTTWTHLSLLLPLCSILWLSSAFFCKPLNGFVLGTDYAQSIGVSVKNVRLGVIGVASILTGAITAFCGPVGFVGIAVPHLSRTLFKTMRHEILLPANILLGASFTLTADFIAHLSPTSLPINAILALLGVPIIIWMILKNPNLRS